MNKTGTTSLSISRFITSSSLSVALAHKVSPLEWSLGCDTKTQLKQSDSKATCAVAVNWNHN